MDEHLIFMGRAGFLLFTLGLLLGVALSKMRNPRMGLSAHLTAVQTGPALIAFALLWRYFSVPPSFASMLIYALVFSSYLLVAGITLASLTGASEALPIAGAGHHATPLQERFVSVLVRGSSVVMALCCIAICVFFLTNS
jgi:hydroxylaminobenzene mutase